MSMRVKHVSPSTLQPARLAPLEEKSSSGSFGHGFERHLHDTDAAEYQAYLNQLKDNITRQGELIGQKADIAQVQRYREMIMELFRETASNSYVFVKKDRFDARGRHKVFSIINKVNARLDELAAQVLEQEADHLRILDIVDDIRGMLVDLLM